MRRLNVRATLLLVIGVLALLQTAGAGADGTKPSLACTDSALSAPSALPQFNPSHWGLQLGHTAQCTISNVTLPSGDSNSTFNSANNTVTVFVKHSTSPTSGSSYTVNSGNELIAGTYNAAAGTVTFTYDTSKLQTCQTANVGVDTPGNNLDMGIAYLTKYGDASAISCDATPPPPSPASALTAGTGTGTPTFTRTYAWGVSKSVDKSSADIASGSSATFTYTVDVTRDSGTDSAWAVSGTITASNPNGADVTGVTASDSINDGNSSCSVSEGAQTVPANGSATWHYSCTYSAAPGASSQTDSASVSWSAQTLSNASPLAAGSASGTSTIDWRGGPTTTIDGAVDVNDTLKGDLGIVTGASNFVYSIPFFGNAGTCTDYPNTVTIANSDGTRLGSDSKTVTVCAGSDLSVTKTATPSFTRTYSWAVNKTVDQARQNVPSGTGATFNYAVDASNTHADSNWQVAGQITVTNPNDWEAITANVADAIDNGGTCAVDGGTSVNVAVGATATLDYLCSYDSAPSAADGTDTATATWDGGAFSTPDGSTSGQATSSFDTPTTIVNGSVVASDTLGGSLGTVSYTDSNPTEFDYPLTFTAPAGTCTTHPNEASVSTPGGGGVVLDTSDASATICGASDLSVTKTASASFKRSYGWNIAKAASPTLVEQFGGTANANYTVNVTHDSGTDSAWKVTGNVTVVNPNDWEGIIADVTDAIDNGGTCVVNGGSGVAIPAGGVVTLPYTCSYSSAPTATAGNDTATAAWSATSAATAHGSVSGQASSTFGTPAIVDGSVTLADSLFTGALAPVSYTDATPKTINYSLTFSVPSANCVTKHNTVAFTTSTSHSTDSASANVELCGPAATVALSMGFWSNKNGQAAITGSAATNGVCNLVGQLRAYAPFQDLSGTASCSAVNTYVQNVIKAASAAGTAMNAMLKAQTLTIALDADLIAGPPAIGGVVVDLKHIGGTEDVSASFGGASSLSISQMLVYAAGQSNAGGSTWYGQNKATQGLAKDAFDAIANQRVFAP